MSLIINEKKMKFCIFGDGFDDERANSGEGNVEDYDQFSDTPQSMAFDNSGTYYWYLYNGALHKFQLSDYTEVAHTVPDTSAYPNDSSLVHPYNVDNNYGVLQMRDSGNTVKVTVFDLTDDSIILQTTYSGSHVDKSNTGILAGTDIYIVNRLLTARSGFDLVHIDLDAGTASYYDDNGDENACGFIDSDTIYTWYQPEWFYQIKRASGKNFSGTNQWSVTASNKFPYLVHNSMMCNGRGYIYGPSYKNSAWRLGEYDGNRAPDFDTPKPLRTFGKFKQKPQIRGWCFNLGATKAAFMTDLGLFVTDFNDIELVSTEIEWLGSDYNTWCPMEMSDDYIIVTDHSYGYYIFSI